MDTSILEIINHCENTKKKAIEFLLSKFNSDGTVGPAQEDGFYFYRLPWSLSIAGETRAANIVCSWIYNHMMTIEGDFDNGLRKIKDAYAYRNATLIYGAHMLRRYDISHSGMSFLLSLQDPLSGGFANNMNENGPSDDMDIPYTVGCGLACIATGYLHQARKVYNYLDLIWKQQSNLPSELYYNLSRKTQEIINPQEGKDGFWDVVVAQRDSYQRWTVGGIAAAFLCRLYLVDPEKKYLDLAIKYMDFSMGSTESQFKYASACKSGWGSSLLYLITGEEKYFHWTKKLAQWFVGHQSEDGSWSMNKLGREELDSESGIIHLTAEFVVHVDTIISCLSARLVK